MRFRFVCEERARAFKRVGVNQFNLGAGLYFTLLMHDDVTAERKTTADSPFADHSGRSAPGNVIGPYRLLSTLGEGGFGSVYLAEQSAPVQRRVALKLIRPGMDSRSVVARFEAERQALALMDHPGVAKVFDGGVTAQGRPFFVMELVRGEPITRYAELNRLSVDQRVQLMIQVCAAVQHAHIKGVLHRDLKPSNILVATVDAHPLAKVIDFGVAKALHQPLSDSTIYTETGQMIGTPEYMSPEQARGSPDIDTRSDIYALGAILYELLTGVTPVDLKDSRSQGYAQVERAIEQFQPAAPSLRLGELLRTRTASEARTSTAATLKRVKGELDWIVLKCLEKDRARRYNSAAALGEDLQRYLHNEPVQAGPPSAAYRASKFVQRHKLAVTAAAVVAVSLISGIAGTSYGLFNARRQTVAAQKARDEAQAVTSFLTDMIHSVQPEEAGRDVTVRQVLDRASGRLATDFTNQPNVESQLRHAIGLSYMGLGQLEEAEAHLPAVVEMRKQTLGAQHIDTLRAMTNLAALRIDQGRHAQAEELLREAVEGFRASVGPTHALTLGATNNLAVLYARRGANDEALAMHRTVYAGQQKALGPEHPHTLGALTNLADLMAEMGRPQDAEPLLRQAVDGWERSHGPDHPGTLTAMHTMAMLELALGRLDEAKATMQRVVDARTRVMGADHLETLSALANLGLILSQQSNDAQAEVAYTTAWNGLRKSLGDGHPTTLTALTQLAGTLEAQGWPERARDTVKSIVESARSATIQGDLPPGNLNDLAWLMLHVEPAELRDVALGLSIAAQACQMERSRRGTSLWMYLDTLAAAQMQAGDAVAAAASQREALDLLPPSGENYRGEMEQRAAEYEAAASKPR